MSEMVKRPAGVTAVAVVAMIGSLLVFLFAVMIITTGFMDLPSSLPSYRAVAIATGAFFGAFAVLGLATSIALLRMRGWARISALVLGGMLCLVGVFGVGIAVLMPTPPDVPREASQLFRPVTLMTFAIQALIGAWWLVQFNLASAKNAFAAASPEWQLGMPLSISITAWASIVGGVLCLVPIIMRMPAIILGVALTGWQAGVAYAFFGALSIYIGRGLLDLDERARRLCIGWYVVTFAHTLLVSYVPSLHANTVRAEQAFTSAQPASALSSDAMTSLVVLLMATITVVAVAFLHRHRALFRREA